jgi:hypothetical protein
LDLLSVEARFFFFWSTADQVQNPRNLSKAQSPSSPVVHGSQKYKKETAFSHQPNPKSKEEKPSSFHPQTHVSKRGTRGFKIIQKKGGKMAPHVKLHFSLLSWRGARGAEVEHFQDKNQLPKAS